MNIEELTAMQISQLMSRGKLTSEEVVRANLDRIGAREHLVKVWAFVDPDYALRCARELDKAPRRSPLHGIPMGFKDVFDTVDMPTSYNSPICFNHRPEKDSACVAILRNCGGLIFGKTETVEFAAGGRPPLTRNPRNLEHTPGGTSSGSAAAVADGMVQLAFGTQTSGSVVRPAAFNGIYGMKPTYGVISREGVRTLSHSLDTIGWFGRCVDDLQLVADVLRVRGTRTIPKENVKQLKIGICRTHNWPQAEDAAHEAVLGAAKKISSAGVAVEEVTLPNSFAEADATQEFIMTAEAGTEFVPEYLSNRQLLHPLLVEYVERRLAISEDELLAAQNRAALWRREFDLIAAKYDAIVTLSSGGEAPRGFASTGNRIFNVMWTLLHVPCVAIPTGTGKNALPVGIQVTGARYGDANLLSVSRHIEKILTA